MQSKFKTYPNPSITSITLNIGKQDLQNLSFQLFDVQGKLVAAQKITSVETTIKMEEYNASTKSYFYKINSSIFSGEITFVCLG